jgi:hypothetical protein
MSRGDDGRTRMTVTWEPETRRGHRLRADAVTLRATTDEGTVLFEGPVSPVRRNTPGDAAAPERAVFEAPPGRVALEMRIVADSGRALDEDVRSIDVPDLHKATIVLSTPAVFRTRTAREFSAFSADPDAAPVTGRVFSRTERLLLRVSAYGAGAGRPSLEARLLNRRGDAMRALDVTPGGTGGEVFHIDVPLAPYAPGEYRIELTARDASGVARDVTVFRVTS